MAVERMESLIKRLNKMKSSRQVAAYMAKQGITGRRASSTRCPVAMLLKRGRAKDKFVSVSVDQVTYGPNFTVAKLSPAVQRFISNFDRMLYPMLLEEDEDETDGTLLG